MAMAAVTPSTPSATRASWPDADRVKAAEAPLIAVPEGARFAGTVTFQGAALIAGDLQGDIWARGSLEVSLDASVRGSIEVDECVVAGRIEGDVTARRRLTLRSGATVAGRVKTAKLSVEEGAVLAGPCTIV
jgi:cytoskeletal protein CcmA (bactofilin family)